MRHFGTDLLELRHEEKCTAEANGERGILQGRSGRTRTDPRLASPFPTWVCATQPCNADHAWPMLATMARHMPMRSFVVKANAVRPCKFGPNRTSSEKAVDRQQHSTVYRGRGFLSTARLRNAARKGDRRLISWMYTARQNFAAQILQTALHG